MKGQNQVEKYPIGEKPMVIVTPPTLGFITMFYHMVMGNFLMFLARPWTRMILIL